VPLTPLQKRQVEDGKMLDATRIEEMPAVVVRAKLMRALEKMDSFAGFFEGGHLSKTAYVNALMHNAGVDALTLVRRMWIQSVPLPPVQPC
jgi:hypothetical protein